MNPTLAILAATSLLAPALVGGARFEPTVTAGEQRLVLHGAELARWKRVVKVYSAALYLEEGATPDRALDDVPRRLEIQYLVPIRADGFAAATREFFRKNVSPAEAAALDGELEAFVALYRDVTPGDRYSITYLPGVGTELSLNGSPLGRVEGAAFSRGLFAIWLGSAPIDAALRKSLLEGGPT